MQIWSAVYYGYHHLGKAHLVGLEAAEVQPSVVDYGGI